MSDATIKRIVEVFHDTEIHAKEISEEIKKTSNYAKLIMKHLTDETLALLVWDMLPVKRRPARSTVLAVLRTLAHLEEHTIKKEGD